MRYVLERGDYRMHSISLKKMTLLGFSGPAVIMLGALLSVAFGRGQAGLLPSTVAALAFYGVLIAVGVAWRDGAPAFFTWMPSVRATTRASGISFIRTGLLLVAVFSVGAIALCALASVAAVIGMSELLWRPLLTIAICLWLGIGLASVIQPRSAA